jgi:hypothetical protein
MNDEEARQGLPATTDHLASILARKVDAIERRLAAIEAQLPDGGMPLSADTQWRWTEEVDRAVSCFRGRRRRGESYRFEIPPSLRDAA